LSCVFDDEKNGVVLNISAVRSPASVLKASLADDFAGAEVDPMRGPELWCHATVDEDIEDKEDAGNSCP
jgi:hypothetical protein